MNKYIKIIKFIIVLAIAFAFVWFLVLGPMISFHNNEKALEKAARRYFELNPNMLPTGERVRTLSLKVLYDQSFIENDLFIPYTKKICSVEESWVKVRRENNDYKYYVYLKCGVLTSNIDHVGPTINLNGDMEMNVSIGDEFKDPGVKSIVDKKDGKIDNKKVTIKGKVDTSKIGSYEIKYIAFDDLSNKTTVVRKVNVVQKLNSTIKKSLGDKTYFAGENPNNYLYFSGMLFRVLNIEDNNVRIVADSDIANVNYDAIDEWFKYYDKNINNKSKKYIVKNKYCNMVLTDTTLDTMQCTSYTKSKKYGLLSIVDINNSTSGYDNYLITGTITWLGNTTEDGKGAYAFRYAFNGISGKFMAFDNQYNYGVRPVITIKGDMLIKSGNGTSDEPYVLEDYVETKKNVLVNERNVGEYIYYSGLLWRIQAIEKDGTTRVICEKTLRDSSNKVIKFDYDSDDFYGKNRVYNPKVKGNIAYKINNMVSEYIDTTYFVKHEIEVPLYKDKISYKKEYKTKKYEVKISAPNIYDMFSAASDKDVRYDSYWVINSSIAEDENNGVDYGVFVDGDSSWGHTYGIRPVAYLDKNISISSGRGTKAVPFRISK